MDIFTGLCRDAPVFGLQIGSNFDRLLFDKIKGRLTEKFLFIAHQEKQRHFLLLIAFHHLFKPLFRICQGAHIRHVKGYNSDVGAAVISRGDALEALLASSVPNLSHEAKSSLPLARATTKASRLKNAYLKIERQPQDVELLHVKINANRRLVVICEDVVAEAIDDTSFSDSDVAHDDALGDAQLVAFRAWAGLILFTELTNRAVIAKLVIWSGVRLIGKGKSVQRSFAAREHGPLNSDCWQLKQKKDVSSFLRAQYHNYNYRRGKERQTA